MTGKTFHSMKLDDVLSGFPPLSDRKTKRGCYSVSHRWRRRIRFRKEQIGCLSLDVSVEGNPNTSPTTIDNRRININGPIFIVPFQFQY